MKRLMIIGLWPDDVVKYCTEKCECRRYAFDRIIYHRGGRAGTVRVHLPGLQENELRPDEHRGRRNHKPEILLRLRPEHPEAHMGPGQALLHDVRRAG